jgi:GPH family glycoside/pentoside/hexuronide:cation symporter
MTTADLPAEKLPTRLKFIYGLGDWGTSASTAARNLFWLFFLVSVVGLRTEFAGVVVLVGRVWDSFNDPLVGMLSDHVHTRWGRRRPFFLFGAIPFALTFFLLFVVPPFKSDLALIVYYSVIYLLFDTLYTVINVPYAALTPELTEDYDERSTLAGWRTTIALLAALVAGATFKLMAENLFTPWLAGRLGEEAALKGGYMVAAGLWAITMVIPPLLLFKEIREPERPPAARPALRPLETYRQVFRNRPFRIVALVYLLTFSTADMVVAVFVWFLVFYVRVRPGFDSLVLGTVLGLASATVPITVRLMRRHGKRNIYIASMAIFALVLLIMSQIPPGGEGQVLLAGLFAGFGLGAVNVVPWAMVADVVEQDELQTGQRREGIYAGFLVFFRKLATAITLFVVTRVLAATGFVEGTTGSQYMEQPESALVALRLMIGTVPAVMLALAIVVAFRYPLDRQTHLSIRRELARRRAER